MIYQKQSYVAGNMCDGKLKMSVIAADELVENAVTELMGDLGIDGIVTKEKYNAMWLIAKNNIRFMRRPDWRGRFDVSCWVSKHTSVKLNIDTLVTSEDGEILLTARTELCALDLETARICKTEAVGFRSDMLHEERLDGLEFSRLPKSGDPVESVTVRSTSLDYCYHTNNVEYVRFMLNTYPVQHFKTHEPAQVEIHYASQSYEGEQLDIEKLSGENGDDFIIRRNGDTITSCRMKWR